MRPDHRGEDHNNTENGDKTEKERMIATSPRLPLSGLV